MSLSIYTSFYNVVKMTYSWKECLTNWLAFLNGSGQIVIAVNTSEDDTSKVVREWVKSFKVSHPTNHTSIDVIDAEIPYTDPEFDGKLKALALSHCKEPFCILLDCDERILPTQRLQWMKLAQELEKNPQIDAMFIPVVDLFRDESSFKSVGQKWYIHKNRPFLTRGVVNFARKPDGTIDHTKSDTCELIYKESGDLARTASIMMPNLPDFLKMGQLDSGHVPFVVHLGWLDKEQRIKQSKFWQPVWSARAGQEVKTESTIEELDKIKAMRHILPSWREGMDIL